MENRPQALVPATPDQTQAMLARIDTLDAEAVPITYRDGQPMVVHVTGLSGCSYSAKVVGNDILLNVVPNASYTKLATKLRDAESKNRQRMDDDIRDALHEADVIGYKDGADGIRRLRHRNLEAMEQALRIYDGLAQAKGQLGLIVGAFLGSLFAGVSTWMLMR